MALEALHEVQHVSVECAQNTRDDRLGPALHYTETAERTMQHHRIALSQSQTSKIRHQFVEHVKALLDHYIGRIGREW